MLKNDVIKELLSRKTPEGYYVVTASREALKYIEEKGILIEEIDAVTVIFKLKSRSLAKKIFRKLISKNLIKY